MPHPTSKHGTHNHVPAAIECDIVAVKSKLAGVECGMVICSGRVTLCSAGCYCVPLAGIILQVGFVATCLLA